MGRPTCLTLHTGEEAPMEEASLAQEYIIVPYLVISGCVILREHLCWCVCLLAPYLCVARSKC